MLDDYQERYYGKLWKRSQKLKQKDYAAARELVLWKNKVRNAWNAIELADMQTPDTFNRSLPLGERFDATVALRLHSLSPADIGVEVVFFKRHSETELQLLEKYELEHTGFEKGVATYACTIQPQNAGVFEYGFRMFPKHPLLPHRQDFGLVKWL